MAWGKIDDRLYSSPKWLMTPKGGRALWVTSLSWSMAQLTDGFIPTKVLGLLGGTKADAKSLVEAGLWHDAEDGYQFHDWLEYQPSRAEVIRKREEAKERMRLAREAKRSQDVRANFAGSSPNPDPTRPDPSPISNSPKGGNSPKQAAGFDPQPCGREHDPAAPCGACGRAREEAKAAELKAAREKSKRERAALEAAAQQRRAEAEQTLAELADPEAQAKIQAAKEQALRAVKSKEVA